MVNLFTGPPFISYIYNKQCWVISIINNVGSVISPWFLQPIRTPCHVKMIFWGPSNAFMKREIKNTKLRPTNALFFVLHFINCFHTTWRYHCENNYICLKNVIFFSKTKRRSNPVLWQKPLYQQKCQRDKVTTQTTPQKSSIKQQLRTDLGRSVGVTTATQLVWLTGLRAHLPTPRNSKVQSVTASARTACITLGCLATI